MSNRIQKNNVILPLVSAIIEPLIPLFLQMDEMTLSIGIRQERDHKRVTVLLDNQLIYDEKSEE